MESKCFMVSKGLEVFAVTTGLVTVVLVFSGCIPNDHKFSSLNNTHVLAHSSVGQKCSAA